MSYVVVHEGEDIDSFTSWRDALAYIQNYVEDEQALTLIFSSGLTQLAIDGRLQEWSIVWPKIERE